MTSPIIESLLDDVAALHEANAISQEMVQELAALLTRSEPIKKPRQGAAPPRSGKRGAVF